MTIRGLSRFSIAMLWVLLGCPEQVTDTPCNGHQDCPQLLRCIDGTCQAAMPSHTRQDAYSVDSGFTDVSQDDRLPVDTAVQDAALFADAVVGNDIFAPDRDDNFDVPDSQDVQYRDTSVVRDGEHNGDSGELSPDTYIADADVDDADVDDADVDDADVDDADVADADVDDADVADADVDDAHIADVRVADTRVVDADIADAHVADAGVEDTQVADAQVADAHVADAHVADAHVADARVVDTHVADAHVADVSPSGCGLHTQCDSGYCVATVCQTHPIDWACNNVALNAEVTASANHYPDAEPENAVDGLGEGSESWSGYGRQSLTIDLGASQTVYRLNVNPFGGETSWYYVAEWTVTYSQDGINFSTFYQPRLYWGAGTLVGGGVHIRNGNPGSIELRDPEYLFYVIGVYPTTLRYLRYTVVVGDIDGDSNLNEIEACRP